ncbi:hypothetical protein AAY473_028595 [Plecturocebus cupreus]
MLQLRVEDPTQAGVRRAESEERHFGSLRQVDHLRSGVRNQPGPHGETPSRLKIQKSARHGSQP